MAAENVEVTALRFFISKGLTPAQAAGVVGNMKQESSLNPNAPGGGLFQDIGGRGVPQGSSVILQLEQAWKELPANGLAQLRAAKTPEQAALAFSQYFERPGDPQNPTREKYAREAYSHIKTGQGGKLFFSGPDPAGLGPFNPLKIPNPVGAAEKGKELVESAPGAISSATSAVQAFGKVGEALTNWIENPLTPIKFVGGAILLYIGIRTLTGGTGPAREAGRAGGYTKDLAGKAATVAAVIPK